ncbi:MarR family transcriptional regulator [Micromonospora sp. ATCC 39149]|uniref:Winged helix-turn-helix transcriptional regulator n=1 Tax=Micromonospora carbonacea TaxID=47853 RepID=A0A7D5Y8E4_9ACTN|nr:MarR family transcriptional regulator [Micromonospora sp. ATCC 39149]QLJ97380.1 winged helix-turn-helix transcriptional regulator [Micromonospora carbonacea]
MHVASAIRHHQDAEVAELGLTPAVAGALPELDPDRPLPTRDLAEQLRCDRSNVTALVDKLEQAGLVERQGDPTDRRQKTLVVTEAGRRMRDRLQWVMSDSRLLDGSPTPSWPPCVSCCGRSPTAAAPRSGPRGEPSRVDRV